ncbi:MAG: Maf family protein [Mariprofundus sp.]|nr:Maf family protein [Mariprofundus sp.]
MKVILASQSPRRLALLQSAGMTVEAQPQHIDEAAMPGETVSKTVSRLSRNKAQACIADDDIPIIAADTLVNIRCKAFGQPVDLVEAKQMLEQLSGQTHQVLTGIAVRLGGMIICKQVATRVTFRDLTSSEIDIYLEHNDVLDKAGAYAIQGGAASFIESIAGPLDNVIGLPISTTVQMIEELTAMAADR